MEHFDKMLRGAIEPRVFETALPAREYQRVAADLAVSSKGLLIADDVGLGKTFTSILALTLPETRPAVVVTLTHLPRQWEQEIKKFAPGLTTHIVKKGSPYPHDVPDVYILNYHKLHGWHKALQGTVKTVIFDEVQELRKSDSAKSHSARTLAESVTYRIGLSATPIYNYGIEFYNVLSTLRPEFLGSREEFLREWCGHGFQDKIPIKDPAAFARYVRESCLMIRRTRHEVGRELPGISKVPHLVDSDPAALDEVANDITELAKFILTKQGTLHDRMRAGGDLDWRLRQATGLAKAPYVADFVRLLVESNEPVVLYGWHHAVYDVWEDRLKHHGIKVARYTGEQSTSQKEASVKSFLDGEAKVLIMSLRAGAGLDGLQHMCRTIVFGELDWSPGVMEQCIGRVARDGQPDPVMAYILISDSGSDPIMSDVLGVKKNQIHGVINPNAALAESVDLTAVRRMASDFLQQRGIVLLEVPDPRDSLPT
jgi:SNF2 family DNA or RNA helicase